MKTEGLESRTLERKRLALVHQLRGPTTDLVLWMETHLYIIDMNHARATSLFPTKASLLSKNPISLLLKN